MVRVPDGTAELRFGLGDEAFDQLDLERDFFGRALPIFSPNKDSGRVGKSSRAELGGLANVQDRQREI